MFFQFNLRWPRNAWLALAAIWTTMGCATDSSRKKAVIPFRAEDVLEMQAALDASTMGLSKGPTFSIPTKYYSSVLSFFEPPVSQNVPKNIVEIGSITAKTKQGITTVITLYWYGTSPAVYAVDGVRYMRAGEYNATDGKDQYLDESIAIYSAMLEIFKERPSDLRKCIDLLKKSAGKP